MTDPFMDDEAEIEPLNTSALATIFREQLIACLEECARGRSGLFSTQVHQEEAWPEGEQLRALAMALQNIFAQQEEPFLLGDEFLDLCSMNGESNPGEARLARAFLKRIERNEVGQQLEQERRPW